MVEPDGTVRVTVASPIEHVVVIVKENHGYRFDFAQAPLPVPQ